MKANELRLGNYVMFFKDTPSKVIGFANGQLYIHYNDEKYFITDLDDASPIPLTEEWLLKFGFEDIRELDNIDFKEYRMINEYSFCVQFPCGVEAHCYAGNYPIAIKYLHQLQNLYFALTGKELTMK